MASVLSQLAARGYQFIMFSTAFHEACKVDAGSRVIPLQTEPVSDDLLLLLDRNGKRLVEGILFKKHCHYLQLQRALAEENPVFCLDLGLLYVIKWPGSQSSSSERLFIWVDPLHRGMVLLYHYIGECHKVLGESSYHSLLKVQMSKLVEVLTHMQDRLGSLPVDVQDQSPTIQVESSGLSSEVGELPKVDTERQFNRWLPLGAMNEYSPKNLLELCCKDINVAYENRPVNGVLLRCCWMQCIALCMQDNPGHQLKLEGYDLMWGQHKIGKLSLEVRRWLCEKVVDRMEQSPLSLPLFQLLVVFDSRKAVDCLFVHHQWLLDGVVNTHVWADVHALLKSSLGQEDVLDPTQQRWIQLVLTYEPLRRLCSARDWGHLLSWVGQESLLESINVHDETQADQWFQCMTNVVFLQDFKIRNQWLTWYCKKFDDGFENLCQALGYGDALTHLILWYKFQKQPNPKWNDTIKNLQANKLLTEHHESILELTKDTTETDLSHSEPSKRYPVIVYDAVRQVKNTMEKLNRISTSISHLFERVRWISLYNPGKIDRQKFNSYLFKLIRRFNPIIDGLSTNQWGPASVNVRDRLFDILNQQMNELNESTFLCLLFQFNDFDHFKLCRCLLPKMSPELLWRFARQALLYNKINVFDLIVEHDPEVLSREHMYNNEPARTLIFSLTGVNTSEFSGNKNEVMKRLIDKGSSLWMSRFYLECFPEIISEQPMHLLHFILNKFVDHVWWLNFCQYLDVSVSSLSLKTTYGIDASFYDLVAYIHWGFPNRLKALRTLIKDDVNFVSNHRYESIESLQLKQSQRLHEKKTQICVYRSRNDPYSRVKSWCDQVLKPVLVLLKSIPNDDEVIKTRLCHIINRSSFGLNEPSPFTLLYLAVKYRWDNRLKTALLALGADPNVANRMEGDWSQVNFNVTTRSEDGGSTKATPVRDDSYIAPKIVSVSLSHANEFIIEHVYLHKASINFCAQAGLRISPYLKDGQGNIILVEDGATPLHIAAYQWDADAMQWLIKNGADHKREALLNKRVEWLITNYADHSCQTSPESRMTGIRYYDAQRVLYERLAELNETDARHQACCSVYKAWTENFEMVETRPSTSTDLGFFALPQATKKPSTIATGCMR